MTEIPPDLVEAYLAAHYSFNAEAAQVHVRIGEVCLPAMRLIREFKSPGAFYITAFNPRGKPCSEEPNAAATKLLRDELQSGDGCVLAANGEDPMDNVPAEPGFMVFGPTKRDAEALGRKFEQNAIMWITPNGVPELLLLR